MKLVKVLIVALGLMTIAATASFASVPFITSSTLNQMAVNAETGLVGNVVQTALVGGTIAAGEIINVNYSPATISYLADISVTVQGATSTAGAFAAAGYATPVTVGAAAVTVNAGSIVVAFPAGATFVTGDTIQVNGVRVDVHSIATVSSTMTVTVSSVLGEATVTNPNVFVAVFVEPLAAPTISNDVVFLQDGTAVTDASTVTLTELFTNAFETKATGSPVVNATQLILQISNIPSGLKFVSATSIAVPAGVAASINTTLSNFTNGKIVLDITDQNPDLLDYIAVRLNWDNTLTDIPLSPADATITATLGPAATGPLPYTGSLKYAARLVTGNQGFEVTPLMTKLLATFNAVDANFETGIAIANLSGSNASSNAGLAGTVTVTLYPLDGSGPMSFTTSASTNDLGLGLDSQGRVPATGTWAVLVSQLLEPAGIDTGSFEGFIVFTANFPSAKGVNYLADSEFSSTSQGYDMVQIAIE